MPRRICYPDTIVAAQLLLPQGGKISKISARPRKELIAAVSERYQAGTAREKGCILDEFVALTGYHRKHAIRILNGGPAKAVRRRAHRYVYDQAVTEALVALWEASDRVCGKRLKALLNLLVPALEHHGHVRLEARVRDRLMTVSAATIDRRLAETWSVTAVRRRRRATRNTLRSQVPVRTFADWQDPPPGFVEVDLVVHCGGVMAGSLSGRWRSLISPAAGRTARRC